MNKKPHETFLPIIGRWSKCENQETFCSSQQDESWQNILALTTPPVQLFKVKHGGITSALYLIVWITRLGKKNPVFLFVFNLVTLDAKIFFSWIWHHCLMTLSGIRWVFRQWQTPNILSNRCITDTWKSHCCVLKGWYWKVKKPARFVVHSL